MTPQEEGKLIATVGQVAETLNEVRGDVKGILKVQAGTEERLSHGAGHFTKIDQTLKEHETEISTMPNGRTVYAALTIGFTILGLLITVYKFL